MRREFSYEKRAIKQVDGTAKRGTSPITIFHKDAQIHDREVGNTSLFVIKQLEFEFPMLTFRYRKDLSKK